jgi:DNA-3-methyladenine glycosylase II
LTLVPVDPSTDLVASLSRLGRHGDDLIERFDGRTLVRALRRGTRGQAYAATIVQGGLEVRGSAGLDDAEAAAAVDASVLQPGAELAELAARDPVVGRLAARYPGLRVVLDSDPLAGLVRAVSAQQINLGFAATVRRRLAQAYGEWQAVDEHGTFVLDPDRLAAAAAGDLRALQFTVRKGETIIELARAVVEGRLALDRLALEDDDGVIEALTALRGIGRWTAEWFLARDLGRPRVVAGDLGVRKAVGLAYREGVMPSEAETRALTAHWGAAATSAQALVLHALALGELPG